MFIRRPEVQPAANATPLIRGADRPGLASAITAALGTLAWTIALAPASADPVPPVDPVIPLPAPADPGALPLTDPAAAVAPPQTLLSQLAQSAQSNPVASMHELLASSPQPAAIGLGTPPPGTDPGPDPMTLAQSLMPQNFRMPTADQVSPYALAPNTNPSPFARIDAFKGVHALAHSNLGRMPGDQLGQPLPGTAPPPGSNIPAGLEQFYTAPIPVPAPEAAPPAVPPVDPLLLPTVPGPN